MSKPLNPFITGWTVSTPKNFLQIQFLVQFIIFLTFEMSQEDVKVIIIH